MAKRPKTQDAEPADQAAALAHFLSQKASFAKYEIWVVGDTPLIVHAWSEKARREMLTNQTKAIKAKGKAPRDPMAEFTASLYKLKDGGFGFPATAIKKAMLSAAHKDKGIARDMVMRSFWIRAEFVQVRTAFPEASCDLPLLRLYGTEPTMREDMVRIGSGLNKTANLAWRGEFKRWAIKITGRFNSSVLSDDAIRWLITESGGGCGVGDWRNEKNGMFGMYHPGDAEEHKAWDRFAAKKGPLPPPKDLFDDFLEAAE